MIPFEQNLGDLMAKALQPAPVDPVPVQNSIPSKPEPRAKTPEPPAFQDLIVSLGGTTNPQDTNQEHHEPDPHNGPATTISGLVLYGNGRYVLLRGQAIPFGATNPARYDMGICHVLTVQTDHPEISLNWADGLFGFSGRRYQTVAEHPASTLTAALGDSDPLETLFPAFCLRHEDCQQECPVTMMDPLAGKAMRFSPLAEDWLRPFCAAQRMTLTDKECQQLTYGLLASFGLCPIYLTSRLGPACHPRHVPMQNPDPDYLEFIRQPRTLVEVLENQHRFGLTAPTVRLPDGQVRKRLNAAAEVMRSRLTSRGRWD